MSRRDLGPLTRGRALVTQASGAAVWHRLEDQALLDREDLRDSVGQLLNGDVVLRPSPDTGDKQHMKSYACRLKSLRRGAHNSR
jgi:hypothetical protein